MDQLQEKLSSLTTEYQGVTTAHHAAPHDCGARDPVPGEARRAKWMTTAAMGGVLIVGLVVVGLVMMTSSGEHDKPKTGEGRANDPMFQTF